MKSSLAKNLCCPSCKGELVVLSFSNESPSVEGDGLKSGEQGKLVKDGLLLCSNCHVWYPVCSYVPVMLIFETPFHRKFAADHADRIRPLSDYRLPYGEPERGERSVQETYTDEWNCVQDDELSYTYSKEDLRLLNSQVWLKWARGSNGQIKSVLNVGCGLGRESVALREVTGNAEIFAIDLNFGLLRSGQTFGANPNIHLTIASLFHLPFKPSSFDLVYSQGVIHRTFSTSEALKSISTYVRKGGHLFIWIYGLDDHLVRSGGLGLLARLNYRIEVIFRPLISRSPKVVRDILFAALSLICHPLVKTRVRHKASWNLKNTNHDLRDWLSPRYAHRHAYNEVLEWFEELGFAIVDVQSPAAYRQLFHKSLWGVGVTGSKL